MYFIIIIIFFFIKDHNNNNNIYIKKIFIILIECKDKAYKEFQNLLDVDGRDPEHPLLK